jgi:hypothetical protein
VEDADVLLWRPAPSTLFLGGGQQPLCSFMQARQGLPPIGVAWTVRCLRSLSSCSARPHEAPPHEGLFRWASVVGLPLGRSWAVEGAQEQVDRDTRYPKHRQLPFPGHGGLHGSSSQADNGEGNLNGYPS